MSGEIGGDRGERLVELGLQLGEARLLRATHVLDLGAHLAELLAHAVHLFRERLELAHHRGLVVALRLLGWGARVGDEGGGRGWGRRCGWEWRVRVRVWVRLGVEGEGES